MPNNNNEEEEVYYNTVLQYSKKKHNSNPSPVKVYYRIVRSFSVRPEKQPLLKQFLSFCEREHITFSDGVVWALEDFVKRHSPPNPQPTLDRLFNIEMPTKPNTMCFVPRCRAKARFQLTLRNFHGEEELFNVCWKHHKWKHKTFRFLVRMKELRM